MNPPKPKYKTDLTPEYFHLKIHSDDENKLHEVYCRGYYYDGTRERSLDGYYFKTDLIELIK